MATYAIGDIQGCWNTLQLLLERINYRPSHDRIWLVGDLVNRGPNSLEVLRWAKAQGDNLKAVLGNHDLHLLIRSEGLTQARPDDSLDDILAAPDRDALLQWVRELPFLHREGNLLLMHAGILPNWNVEKAEAHARFLEKLLRSEKSRDFLACCRKVQEGKDFQDPDLLLSRFLTGVFTRLRVCDAKGNMDLGFKGGRTKIPQGLFPWFEVPGKAWNGHTVVAGHWAALGFHMSEDAILLDSGCVWGNCLTAIRLEDRTLFQEPSAEKPAKN